jgi:hypothetical protein
VLVDCVVKAIVTIISKRVRCLGDWKLEECLLLLRVECLAKLEREVKNCAVWWVRLNSERGDLLPVRVK